MVGGFKAKREELMTDHKITVTLSGEHRKLIPNQGQNRLEVNAEDTVTWELPEGGMQVNFLAFVPRDPRPGASQGNSPFTTAVQPTDKNTVSPDAGDGLYLYTISDNQGNVLQWEPPPLFTVGSSELPPRFEALLASIIKPVGPP
jgi:hypothetical protein